MGGIHSCGAPAFMLFIASRVRHSSLPCRGIGAIISHPGSLGYARARAHTHLRPVGEVAELRLPEAERVRVLERVSHLEAEDTELRKDGVSHRKLGLSWTHSNHTHTHKHTHTHGR